MSLLRLILVSSYWSNRHAHNRFEFYKNLQIVGIYISGAIWGSLILITRGEATIWIDAFIAFVIAGMSTGVLFSLSAVLSAAIPYLLLLLLPLATHFYLQGDMPHFAMGLMSTLFLLLLVRIVFRSNSLLVDTIKQDLENKTLFNFLEKARRETEKLKQLLEDQGERLPEILQERASYFESSIQPAVITDDGGRIKHVNNALLKSALRDEEELVGAEVISLFNQAECHQLRKLITRASHSSVTPISLHLVRGKDHKPASGLWHVKSSGKGLLFWTFEPDPE